MSGHSENYSQQAEFELESRKRTRIAKTFTHMTAYFINGCSFALIGTTMVDMEEILNIDTKTIGMTFMAHGIGFLIGAVLCGVLFNRFNAEIQLSIVCFLKAALLILAPWIPEFAVYFTVILLSSIMSGYFAACSQPFTVNLWQGSKYLDPVMQAGHTVFSVGATVGPAVVQMYLSPDETTEGGGAETNAGKVDAAEFYNISTNSTTVTNLSTSVNVSYKGKVQFSFMMLGALFILPAVIFSVFVCNEKAVIRIKNIRKKVADTKRTSIDRIWNKQLFFRCSLLALVFMYSLTYHWMEVTFWGYIPVFVIKGLRLPKHFGTSSASVFFGCFTLGRVLAVPMSFKVPPRVMLIIHMSLTFAGLIALLFVQFHVLILWAGIILVGLGLAAMFASLVLWTSRHTHMEGSASAVLVCGAGVGVMTGPALTGLLFQTYGHQWMVYIILIACGMNYVLLICMESLVFTFNKASTTDANKTNIELQEIQKLTNEQNTADA